MSDSGEKKHPASAKKLRDQRKKGQVAQSQDVGKLLVLTSLSEIALYTADSSLQRFQQLMLLPLSRLDQPFTRALEEVLVEALLVFAAFALLMAAVAIAVKLLSSWMQFGLLFAPETLKLDFNRLNPLNQAKQMFSAQSLMNLLMGIAKALLLGLVLYVVIGPALGALINLASGDLPGYILALISVFRHLLHACLGLLLVLALIDLALQKYFFAKRMRMTQVEVVKEYKDMEGDPIIVHADVRRMLLTMKASNEGGRAFSTYVANQLDIAKFSEDPMARERADALVALLTPVAKAFLTDLGLETTVHGQQIFGGHGYIREWGQEQLVRDVRITQIYEGTNGIQALDLVGRKVVANGGVYYRLFADEIRQFIASAHSDLSEFTQPLASALDTLDALTAWVLDRSANNPNEIGAASVEYLQVFGYTAYAYMWAMMAKAALSKASDEAFYISQLGTARFYFARLLPRIHSLSASVRAGSESLYLLDEAHF